MIAPPTKTMEGAMPLIDVYLSETVLDPEGRQVLADSLARLVRAAEGYGDSRLAARSRTLRGCGDN